MLLTPREHQEEVLKALREKRKEGAKSALIVMATGLGKTYTSAFDVDQYMSNHDGRALLLCHNNEILRQNMQSFEKVLDGKFSYGLFNGEKKIPDADFVFASFQTMAGHKEEFAPDTFSYIVVDEAHHAPAKTFRTVIDYFQPDFLLGMTATPERPDGLKLENIFGPITYNLGLVEAIKKGLLVDINYHLVLDEMAELNSLEIDGQKFSKSELNSRLFIPMRDEEIARITKERLAERPGSSALIFCKNIEYAEMISTLLEGSEVVHSGLSPQDNKVVLDRFRAKELPIIVSVDQLNEGVDVPHADVIVFLRSTASQIVFYQQLGRGLRLHDGKDYATVLDFVGNIERLQMASELQQALNTPSLDDEDASEAEKEPKEKHFIMTVEAPQFTDQEIDVIDVLNRIDEISWGWSNEELIAQVQMLAKKLGRTPTQKEFNQDSRTASAKPAKDRFGSWNAFLKAAGLKATHSMRIPAEELIAQVQMLAKELGRTPTSEEFGQDPRVASDVAAIDKFGSWNNFLKAAGLEVTLSMRIPAEELIAQVQMLAKELGRTPTSKEFGQDPRVASCTTVAIKFGSWNSLIKAAGLKLNHRLSDEELVEQVQIMAKELGRTPTSTEFNKDRRFSNSATVAKRFGSWNKFLEVAGLKPNQVHKNI